MVKMGILVKLVYLTLPAIRAGRRNFLPGLGLPSLQSAVHEMFIACWANCSSPQDVSGNRSKLNMAATESPIDDPKPCKELQ
jgi:hypothetical protein